MIHTTFTLKQDSLHYAYAPEFDLSAHGGCRGVSDELRQQHNAGSQRAARKIAMSSADRSFLCKVCGSARLYSGMLANSHGDNGFA
jgi:hypothetical protein